MDVLIFTKYGARAASSRQRFLQFMPYLEARGIHCEVSALLDDAYLNHRFRSGRVGPSYVARGFFDRLRALSTAKRQRRHDLVVVQYELFSYLPSSFEHSLRSAGLPYVYDLDDAVFHTYDRHRSSLVRRLYGQKIARVVNGAAQVVAGSRYLADYARSHNACVETVPTVVDTAVYSPSVKTAGPFTVGWIGSPSTSIFLRPALEPLAEFFAGKRVRLVGSGPINLHGIPAEVVDWNEDSEVQELRSFDVGIMPLTDDPWSRGKCGYKLIQYMACGIPVIASPVGANLDIVEHGVNGFLATTPAEWLAALRELESKPALRKSMGEAGRSKVEAHYSLRYAAPRIEALYRSAAGKRP